MKSSVLEFFCKADNKNNGLCKNVLTNTKTDICNNEVEKHYKKGEHIAFQNDKVSSLYMLTKGKVRTEIISRSGFALPIEEIKAPAPLAAAFLFATDNRFPVDVVAMEECDVVIISRLDIEKKMAECPAFLRAFLAFNANRTKYLSDRLKIFAQKSIKSKLAYYLLKYDTGEKFRLNKSVAALADYFGVERSSLSRTISDFVRDGIISYDSGVVTIKNYKSIQDILS